MAQIENLGGHVPLVPPWFLWLWQCEVCENKVSLSALFIFFTAVLRRMLWAIHNSFLKLTLQWEVSSGDNAACLDDSCLLRSLLVCSWARIATTRGTPYCIFVWVGWPNIGLAATRPARPLPTVLINYACVYCWVYIEIVEVTLILVAGTQGTLIDQMHGI